MALNRGLKPELLYKQTVFNSSIGCCRMLGVVYPSWLCRFAVISALLVLAFVPSTSAQLVLLSPSTIEAASGETFDLHVRCDFMPESLAAALILRASTPAILPPVPHEATLEGVQPSLDVIDATEYIQIRFALAAGDGITSIRSRINLAVGDEGPVYIEAVELIYVPPPGPGVTRVQLSGIRVTLNPEEESASGEDD